MQQRLVFIVEGDCEVAFINKKVIPYLYASAARNGEGWTMNVQKITTNRKLNKSGGNVSYAYLRNEINRVAAQENVWITTFMDFFRLPKDFPFYSTDSKDIGKIEEEIKENVGYEQILPYIQKYEFETLLFSSLEGFRYVLDDDSSLNKVEKIIADYPCVEDINGGSETSPSKRLGNIWNYDKVPDSDIILSELHIEDILAKCPRFKEWIDKLLKIINRVSN